MSSDEELLRRYTADRNTSSVDHPAVHVLDVHDVFDEHDMPRCDVLKKHFTREGRITEDAAVRILERFLEITKQEPNVLKVPAPVSIVGDIHGQFYDLLKVFQVGGDPEKTQYLFLGDYVDRGYFSLECVLYLWALKIKRPDGFWFLRGNHECRHLTEYFTFKTEVDYKCSDRVYDLCMETFDSLPLAAVMNEQFFCVHGGISPELLSIDDVNQLDRFVEPDEAGLLCDLLWADPHEDYDSLDDVESGFMHNETRGCSYVYTHKAVCDFLNANNLLSVIRAHEAQDAGYRMYKANPATGFPSLITIFSAPNYLDVYGNKAAVMIYSNNSMNIKKFSHSPHPYWLPNFMDVFTWSLPFIGEKTTEMLEQIMSVCTADELADNEPEFEELVEKMKNAMTRVRSTRQSFSEQADYNFKSLRLKGAASPSGDLPSVDDVEESVKTFAGVKEIDKVNETRPSRQTVTKAKLHRKRQTLEDIQINPEDLK